MPADSDFQQSALTAPSFCTVPPMREIGGLVGALATLVLLGGSDLAGAATLKASYPLQGSRVPQLAGAPDLIDIGPGNHFVTDTVDGVRRQVLAFPRGGGVSLSTQGLVDESNHSIVMLFRLTDVFGYRRLLDFSDSISDNGLYVRDGMAVLYVNGERALSSDLVAEDLYVQIALTSETTVAGLPWTVVYVNGSPVAAATTPRGFRLGAGALRFFKDNVKGGARGEQSAGALACVLVYDGALTAGEVAQVAADPTGCPAPTLPPPPLPFEIGSYAGTTRQGMPIYFTVARTSVQNIAFRWRARCADGRVHANGIVLGQTRIRRGGRFSIHGRLGTGGYARVSGRLRGGRATGRLSRWGNSAFDTKCPAKGIKWRARVVQDGSLPF